MGEYRDIVEPETTPEPMRRGKATIIQAPRKCKRVHFELARIALGAVALAMLAYGAGHSYGIDASLIAVGLALTLVAVAR